jgi:hypothetical protein
MRRLMETEVHVSVNKVVRKNWWSVECQSIVLTKIMPWLRGALTPALAAAGNRLRTPVARAAY